MDASIAAAALGIGPNDLINDLNTMGFLFETMCVRDLRVYAEALGGSVYHFRNKAGLECDAVVHLRNGSYGLIEIKLGGEKLIREGVETLTSLTESIDTSKMKEPAHLSSAVMPRRCFLTDRWYPRRLQLILSAASTKTGIRCRKSAPIFR